MNSPPEVSVVVPCYNEEQVLRQTIGRLEAVCRTAAKTHEIILVDDGSTDDTWSIIQEAAADRNVRGLRLSRNFGHQAALTAGLRAARGAEVFIIDADLQDPPELLPDMRSRLGEGYNVVYGQRLSRAGETWFKLATAGLFYRLLSFLSDVEIPKNTGDFRLMDRRAVDALLALPESNRFIRGMVAWIGFRQSALGYHRQERAAGTTKYSVRRMLRFSLDAITSFSVRPLRLAGVVGIAMLGVGAAIGAWVIVNWSIGATIRGWASVMMLVLFIGGFQVLLLGVIGEYVGRLFIESKARPLYFIKDDTRETTREVPTD